MIQRLLPADFGAPLGKVRDPGLGASFSFGTKNFHARFAKLQITAGLPTCDRENYLCLNGAAAN